MKNDQTDHVILL